MAQKKYKLPLDVGFAALCDHIKAIRKTAETSGSAVSALAEAVGKVVEEIEAILNTKQDIRGAVPLTIPTTGWAADSSVSGFRYYLDIDVADLSEADVVGVTALPGSSAAARAANFAPVQTLAGKIRLRCYTVPTVEIAAEYHFIDATVNADDLDVDAPTA